MAYYFEVKRGTLCPRCKRGYLRIMDDLSLAICYRCGARTYPVLNMDIYPRNLNGNQKA